jgi:hypothetical protein
MQEHKEHKEDTKVHKGREGASVAMQKDLCTLWSGFLAFFFSYLAS